MSSISRAYFGSILQSKDHSFASMVVKEGKMVELMGFSTVDKGTRWLVEVLSQQETTQMEPLKWVCERQPSLN